MLGFFRRRQAKTLCENALVEYWVGPSVRGSAGSKAAGMHFVAPCPHSPRFRECGSAQQSKGVGRNKRNFASNSDGLFPSILLIGRVHFLDLYASFAIEFVDEGVHNGKCGGIVASSFDLFAHGLDGEFP